MTEEEMQDLFGNQDPFSDFFNTFFGGGGGAREARTRPGRPGDAQPEGPRHRARGRADARGGVSRRHAPDLDQAGRPRAQRRRADSGRRQGRLARPRGRRRRSRRERRRRRRPVPARADSAAPGVRAQGRRPAHEGRAAGHDGGPRRRGAGADDHRLGPAEDSRRRRRAARSSGSRATACPSSASPTTAAISTPRSTSSSPAR